MLKSKEELELYLTKEIYKFVGDRETPKAIYYYCLETYNIPKSLMSDYVTTRKPLAEASEFILFCLLDAIEVVREHNQSIKDKFFAESEIKYFSSAKYNVEKIKFPLKFDMFEIMHDQWIGRTDLKTLMKFRAAQIINYNVNAQRPMQRKVNGEDITYRITVHEKNVSEITEAYRKGEYIPTVITLTIPADSDAEFFYDEEDHSLVVKSIEHFDITDGYHRFLAACRVCDEIEDFNYPMELRISNWSEKKAAHFVWQEDQKTKMNVEDSKAYNMYTDVNQCINRINGDANCLLCGEIHNNDSIINFTKLSGALEMLYFKRKMTKRESRALIMNVSKDFVENINILCEYDTKYMTEEYSHTQIYVVATCFDYYKGKDKSEMCHVIDKITERLESETWNFKTRIGRLALINETRRLIEEVR